MNRTYFTRKQSINYKPQIIWRLCFSLIELLVEYTPFVVSTGNSSFIITWQMKTTDDVIVFHGRMKVDKRVVIFYQLPYLYTSCKKNIIPFFISIFFTAYIGKIFLHIILLWVWIPLMVKCTRYNIISLAPYYWYCRGVEDLRKYHYGSHAIDPMYQPIKLSIARIWRCYYAALHAMSNPIGRKTYLSYHYIIMT
jgi:hypothetical protein